LQPGDVPLTCADVSKARRMLAYAPHVPVAEGLRRYVAWRRRPS
jgi:UDP-glucuronate 4-epimerase